MEVNIGHCNIKEIQLTQKGYSMKKMILFLIFIFPVTNVQAQDRLSARLYLDVGMSFWESFSINENLEEKNLSTINSTIPEVGVGLKVKYRSFTGNVAGNLLNGWGKGSVNSYRLSGISAQLGIDYELVTHDSWGLKAGILFEYLPIALELYSENNRVDLNNLEPNSQSGFVKLYNIFSLIGPSITFGNLFSESGFPVDVNFSYQFNVNHGAWRSEYARVLNSKQENAGRFNIKILIPILHIK